MTRLAIFADDLTGAADSGGAFASVGLRTVVTFNNSPVDDAEVLVHSTGSRGMSASDSARANQQAALALQALPVERRPTWVYKKIDSMLRGHPCEELVAIMAGLGERRALVAPALPAQRRTTIDSRQILDGTPVADLVSTFSCDSDVAVQALHISAVRQGFRTIASALRRMEAGLLIADADTDRDLAIISRVALDSGIRVMAGSAGLARQLASGLRVDGRAEHGVGAPRRGGPILMVAASRNPATSEQIAVLEAAGVAVVRPAVEMLNVPGTSTMPTADALALHLSDRRSVVFTTAGMAPAKLGPRGVARQLAEVVGYLAECDLVGGLVLTGGDVAAEVLARLGATRLTLGGEVQPAIPWSILQSRLLNDVPVVTKAGSFGEPDALIACLGLLLGRPME